MKRLSRVVATLSWSTLKHHHCLFVRVGLCGTWVGLQREQLQSVTVYRVSGGLLCLTYMRAGRR